jgi:hypothetical protein
MNERIQINTARSMVYWEYMNKEVEEGVTSTPEQNEQDIKRLTDVGNEVRAIDAMNEQLKKQKDWWNESGMPNRIYRVNCISTSSVVVYAWGFGTHEVLADEGESRYSSVDELPEWMQQKLSLLMGIDTDKPTEELEGIGRRVSTRVYWVYPSPGERLNGTNTGSES